MPILGLDVGSDATVIASVGRGGVSVIRNEISERLTPTVVAYTDSERLIGDAALSSMRAVYKRSCRSLKTLLGAIPATHRQLMLKEQAFSLTPVTTSAALQNHIGFAVGAGGDVPVTATEAMVAFLKKMKITGEKFIGAGVTDCVVAVPSWYTNSQRHALLGVCRLAGIPCIRTMNEHAATALDYGLFRANTFEAEKPSFAAFVDIGYATTQMFVVEFLQSRLSILSVKESLFGGRDMDMILARHCASAFDAKYKTDVMANTWARCKLVENCSKAKKILSANKEVPIGIECLIEDHDLNVTVLREDFEQMCQPLRKKLTEMTAQLLASVAPEIVENISCVEICGGCIRIPWIQETLQQSFNKPLARTVNPDESVARGAAIQGAMLDPRHRVKEFVVVDRISSPIAIVFDTNGCQPATIGAGEGATSNSAGSANSSTGNSLVPHPAGPNKVSYELFPAGTPYQYVQWITFPCTNQIHSIKFSIEEAGLTPLVDEETSADSQPCVIGQWTVQIPPECSSAPQSRVKIQITMDLNGVIHVGECLHVKEETIIEKVKEKRAPPPAVPQPIGPDGTAPVTAPVQLEEVEVEVPRIKLTKTHLTCECARPEGWLTDADFDVIKKNDEEQAARDANAEKTRTLLNDLQALCFETRENYLEGGKFVQYANSSEVETLGGLITQISDWIDYEADDYKQHPEKLSERMQSLKKAVSGPATRKSEFEAREIYARKIGKVVASTTASLTSPEIAPWILENQTTLVKDRMQQLQQFLATSQETQAKVPTNADPLVKSADLEAKYSEFKKFSESIFADAKARKAAAEREAAEARKKAAAAAAKAKAEAEAAAAAEGAEQKAAADVSTTTETTETSNEADATSVMHD